MNLAHNNPFGIGDKVRCFDIPGCHDLEGPFACFTEGFILGMDIATGQVGIEATKSVFGGIEVEDGPGEMFRYPMNGLEPTDGHASENIFLLQTAEELEETPEETVERWFTHLTVEPTTITVEEYFQGCTDSNESYLAEILHNLLDLLAHAKEYHPQSWEPVNTNELDFAADCIAVYLVA